VHNIYTLKINCPFGL